MQTKIKIKGKYNWIKMEQNLAEIELDLSDLHQQHPELWLGEEEVKQIAKEVSIEQDLFTSPVYIEGLAKALVGKIGKEPKSTEPKCELSACCNAPMTIGGIGDFDDKDKVCTQYYVCTKCKQPCDRAEPKSVEECKHEWNWEGNWFCMKCGMNNKDMARPQGEELPQNKPEQCGICGGKLTEIRGMFPHTGTRKVCPQCCAERLDQIRELSREDYGKCYQVNP